MSEIKVEKKDILKLIYFIGEMSQNVGDKGMFGTIAGKTDLMGGIFDRWINIVPESIIFNKYLLLKTKTSKDVEIITDFYKYSPKQDTTGIAPDVLGLRINDNIIPFVVFNEKWTPIENMPQIEVKTFKKSQQMVSLRDQGYNGKYLVMVESNYRVDYLLPFFEKSYFSDETYNKMIMNDLVFIKSNNNGLISHLKKIDSSNDSLGTLKLLVVTETEKFKEFATYCENNVSPIRISTIKQAKINCDDNIEPLDKYCYLSGSFYKFNDKWYDGKNEESIPFIASKTKNGSKIRLVRYLNFYCDNISNVKILRRNKTNCYIKALQDCHINNYKINKDTIYKIDFTELSRTGTQNGEFFLQKDLVKFVLDLESELVKKLTKIIEEN